MIPREKIDEVRERTNLVEVIKRHVELKRAGTASWKGLCPFHAEKTPSFHVHEQKQFFHCFGCGAKGDVFSFLEQVEQRSFVEVLRDLARDASVELPERNVSPAEKRAIEEAESERTRMFRVMELAVSFFEEQLHGAAGAAARAYVGGRGISQATAERFRLGYAPGGFSALSGFLASKQVPPVLAERVGLVGVNERGRYDFFRDRVMLPVIDRQKRPVGFSSRLLDPEAKERKYVNSPDTPLFHKKEVLYGLHAALEHIRKSRTAVVVEGNFDVLALHEAGIGEAVAPMGTALTAEQIATLGRIAERVVVIFDGDAAGERAARKVLPLFLELEVDGRVAKLPSGKDPDEFVRAEGAEAFRKLVAEARPMVEQAIDNLSREIDPTAEGQLTALEQAAQLLAMVRNGTLRDLYVARAAEAFRVDRRHVQRAIVVAKRVQEQGATKDARRAAPPAAAALVNGGREPEGPPAPADELQALALVGEHPTEVSKVFGARLLDLLTNPTARHLYRTAMDRLQLYGRLDVPEWLDGVEPAVARTINTMVLDGRFRAGDPAAMAAGMLATFEKKRIQRELALAKDQLLKEKDEAVRAVLTSRVNDLLRTMHPRP